MRGQCLTALPGRMSDKLLWDSHDFTVPANGTANLAFDGTRRAGRWIDADPPENRRWLARHRAEQDSAQRFAKERAQNR